MSGAELALAAALSRLLRARGTPDEEQARKNVEAAQRTLSAVGEAVRVVAERRCCDMPMTWCGGEWICTRGHD